MAIDKVVNLAPTTSENSTYSPSGSVSTRDFRILRSSVINNTNYATELTVAVDGLAISVGSYEQGILVGANYNFNGTGLTITNGAITIKNNDGTNVLYADVNGNLYITGNIDASSITTGTLSTSRIPNLSADKITSGTINASIVNVTNLNAANITTGTLNASRVVAGYLTAGTIGGWTINSSTISRNGITLGADYISLGNTGTTGSTINLGSSKIYNIGGSGVGFSSYITVASDISPQYDNTSVLGSSYARFQEVWAVDGTINTSDMEDKTDIKLIENGVDFILNLKPVQFKWNGRNRNHYGFLAQEVKEAMTDSNIEDAGAYIDPSISGQEGYKGLRYNEFIAPMVQTIQSLEKRISELESGN